MTPATDQDIVNLLVTTSRQSLPADMLPQLEENLKWLPGQTWSKDRLKSTNEHRYEVYRDLAKVALRLHATASPSGKATLEKQFVWNPFRGSQGKEYCRRGSRDAGWPVDEILAAWTSKL